MGDSLEILIVLGVVIAGAFWIKNQYPESGVAKGIDSLLAQGLAIVKKPAQQDTGTDPSAPQSQESVNPVTTTPSTNVELQVSVVDKEKLGVAETPLGEAPEDSVLRRHYFATKAAERAAITHPYPTDSVLRRHHESRLGGFFISSIASAEPAILSLAEPAGLAKVTAPEDHVLKRHFLTQLRAEVEARFLPRPTDSTLSRHYESLIQAEVAARLQAAV
jgi:hypothetical protein